MKTILRYRAREVNFKAPSQPDSQIHLSHDDESIVSIHAADIINDSRDGRGQSYMPRLTKPGYSTSPSMDDLMSMTEDQLKQVDNFTVSSPYGKIDFMEPTDVTFQDLDMIVNINLGSIEVYPDEDGQAFHTCKPAVGTKLNKPAKLHYYQMTLPSYNEVARVAKSIGAKLVDYLPHSRTMAVRVEHFTKFQFDAEESDGDESIRNTDSQPRKDRAAIVRPSGLEPPVMRSFTLPIVPGRDMDIEQPTSTNPASSTYRDMLFNVNDSKNQDVMFKVTINNEGSTTNAMIDAGGSNYDISTRARIADRFKASSDQNTLDINNRHPFDLDFDQIDSILAEMNISDKVCRTDFIEDTLTNREQELVDIAECHMIE